MLEELKDVITSFREAEGKELLEAMRMLVNDAESLFDKIVEGTNDEDTRKDLAGKLVTVVLLSIVMEEKAGCQNSADTDRVFDALPDFASDLKMI